MNILLYLIFILWLNVRQVQLGNNECLFVDCECQSLFEFSFSVFCQQTNSNEFPLRNKNISLSQTTVSLFFIKSYNLGNLPEDSFAGLDINTLKLENNRIQVIDKFAFRDLKRLVSFSFNDPSLRLIETDAFTTFYDQLEHLDFSGCEATTDKMDFFFNDGGLKKFHNLKSLRLDSNKLTTLSANWLGNFEKLIEVSFAFNELKSINQFLFKYNLNVVSVSFANNNLNRFFDTFLALEPLANTLESLNLRSNSFDTFSNFPNLKNLKLLDLSKNYLKEIDEKTFQSLESLKSLYLSFNKLERIHPESFSVLKNIENLYLDENFLVESPKISTLTELKYLTLENQNGHIKSPLKSFSFRIENQTSSFFELNLARNYLTSFEDKLFCSIKLNRLTISLNSLNNLDKCILRQVLINNNITSLSLFVTEIYDYTLLCMNCDTRLLLANFNVNLNGACGNYSMETICSNKLFVDTCSSQVKYSCLSGGNESVTTTATTTSEKLTSSSTNINSNTTSIQESTTLKSSTTNVEFGNTTTTSTTTTTKKCLCNKAMSNVCREFSLKNLILINFVYFILK
jgi:hypothetical protein